MREEGGEEAQPRPQPREGWKSTKSVNTGPGDPGPAQAVLLTNCAPQSPAQPLHALGLSCRRGGQLWGLTGVLHPERPARGRPRELSRGWGRGQRSSHIRPQSAACQDKQAAPFPRVGEEMTS